MPKTLTLKSQKRNLFGKKVASLRKQGMIPAVLYGAGSENKYLTLGYRDFEQVYQKAGESTLIDLSIESEKSLKVLIQDIKIDPVTGKYQHVDFYQVRMDKRLKAKVSLNFVGESPAVKDLGGVLVKNMSEIEIECLPQALIHQVDVELASLETIGDRILIKDLKVPENVTVLNNPGSVVVIVEQQKVEVVVVEAPKAEEVQKVEAVATEEKTPETKEGEGKEKEEEEKKA